MNVGLIVGQATGPGRLTAAAGVVSEALADLGAKVTVVDLHTDPVDLCDGRPEESYGPATRSALGAIHAAEAVVVASPVYRATYPGVLKNLLDLLPVPALRNKPVGLVTVGASDHHYLGVDGDLRRVLAWFGAIPLPNSVYLSSAAFDAAKAPTAAAVDELRELARSLVTLTGRLAGEDLGPPPLAARAW